MYEVILEKQVLKFLEKHKWEFIIEQFEKSLISLIKNPFDSDLDIKPLKWLDYNYRLRIWKYRFLYVIKKEKLYIYFYKWWNRWEVYKNL
jgi:mRNA interferase RelE/StbE